MMAFDYSLIIRRYFMEHWTNYIAPIFLMGIKVIALAIAGFFAIKWHFDEERRVRAKQRKQQQ